MDNVSKQPVFIVGPLRSGTTFLRLILDMHPKMNFFGEFEEAVEFLDDAGFISAERYSEFLGLQRAFLSKNLTVDPTLDRYEDMVEDFWRQLAERTEKPIMGASIHSRFDRCPDLWPDAKYIHLVRDPRDVARSCIGMGWVGNVYHGADYWLKAERRWDALVKITSEDQRCEIRYEDLVSDPAGELTKICDFLGVEYAPVLLDYPKHTSYGPPDASLAYQWRRRLTGREVSQVESRIGPMMSRRGYEPTTKPAPLPIHERVYLGVHNRFGRARFGIDRFGWGLWLKGRAAKLVQGSKFYETTRREMNLVAEQHLK